MSEKDQGPPGRGTSEGLPHKDWTILFYLPGDAPEAVAARTEQDLAEILRASPGQHMHLAAQIDRPNDRPDKRVLIAPVPTCDGEPHFARPGADLAEPLRVLTGAAMGQLPQTDPRYSDLTVSPDGAHFALGGVDGFISIWSRNGDSWSQRPASRLGNSWIDSLAWSPDSTKLAITTGHGLAAVLVLADDRTVPGELTTIGEYSRGVFGFANETTLILGSDDGGATLHRFDSTGLTKHRGSLVTPRGILTLGAAPEANTLAYGNASVVMLTASNSEAKSQRVRQTLHLPEFASHCRRILFNADGSRMVVDIGGGHLALFHSPDPPTGGERKPLRDLGRDELPISRSVHAENVDIVAVGLSNAGQMVQVLLDDGRSARFNFDTGELKPMPRGITYGQAEIDGLPAAAFLPEFNSFVSLTLGGFIIEQPSRRPSRFVVEPCPSDHVERIVTWHPQHGPGTEVIRGSAELGYFAHVDHGPGFREVRGLPCPSLVEAAKAAVTYDAGRRVPIVIGEDRIALWDGTADPVILDQTRPPVSCTVVRSGRTQLLVEYATKPMRVLWTREGSSWRETPLPPVAVQPERNPRIANRAPSEGPSSARPVGAYFDEANSRLWMVHEGIAWSWELTAEGASAPRQTPSNVPIYGLTHDPSSTTPYLYSHEDVWAVRHVVAEDRSRSSVWEDLGKIDSGSPTQILEFIRWGLETCPSNRVALVFSGHSELEAAPGTRSPLHAPNAAASPRPQDGQERGGGRQSISRRLFMLCHDMSEGTATDITQLRGLLQEALDSHRDRVDLIVLDLNQLFTLEVAHELEGLADTFVGRPWDSPDGGVAWDKVIAAWDEHLCDKQADDEHQGSAPDRIVLAQRIVDSEWAFEPDEHPIAAADLSRLNEVVRPFDAFTSALFRNLSDDLIWSALEGVLDGLGSTADIRAFCGQVLLALVEADTASADGRPGPSPGVAPLAAAIAELDDIGALLDPDEVGGVLRRICRETGQGLSSTDALHLRIIKLGLRVLAALATKPNHLVFADKARRRDGEGHPSVYEPAPTLALFAPAMSSGEASDRLPELQLHRRVHWISLLRASHMLANRQAQDLWSLVIGALEQSSGSARHELLRRLAELSGGEESLLDQFSSLALPSLLTLSLESIRDIQPHAGKEGASVGRRRHSYRLRLASSDSTAALVQQNSRVNQRSIDDALRGLEELLAKGWATNEEARYLYSLGRILGEDIIQGLSDRLEFEHRQLEVDSPDGAVHLALRLPRELMRYPWEVMHDRQGLLCERFAVGRQVWMDTGLPRAVGRMRSGALRVLIVGDPILQTTPDEEGRTWQQLPGARQEAEHVARLFEDLALDMGATLDFHRGRDVLIGREVTKERMRRLLREGGYDIVHYAGHSIFSENDPESSAWILSDGPLWARELRNTLAWMEEPPWLVFANACEAGMDSDKEARRYQGDVFGLATAFINQGVSAYIAPLWPVDDQVALTLGEDFYRSLLLDKQTLGAALQGARLLARDAVMGTQDRGEKAVSIESPRSALSWASFVLYGDPTGRLSDTAAPAARRKAPERLKPLDRSAKRPVARRKQRRRILQDSVESAREMMDLPGFEALPTSMRGGDDLPDDAEVLELVEINGLRMWRVLDVGTGESTALSGMEDAAVSDEVRQLASGNRGALTKIRMLGRWIVKGGTQPIRKIDTDTVSREQLLDFSFDGALNRPRPLGRRLQRLNKNLMQSSSGRILLIVHGTGSKSLAPAQALGTAFLSTARQRYEAVIAFDHWTLSKSPRENARDLKRMLEAQLPSFLRGTPCLDLITHSRGGLVARAFAELEGGSGLVHSVCFAGTPNTGTTLASSSRAKRSADYLTNVTRKDRSGGLGRMMSVFLRSAVKRAKNSFVSDAPGLYAMDPQRTSSGDFLGQLSAADRSKLIPKYSALTSNWTAPGNEVDVRPLARARKSKAGAKTIDQATDRLFRGPNDMVVDTNRVWSLHATRPSETLQGGRVLLFDHGNRLARESNVPTGVRRVTNLADVHHTNLLAQREAQRFVWEMFGF
ncbi:MAG: CHAT domain-containing protein [Deltaproteobacteria bacterium]|nr:CHAT domain-containing protein [Deltaproteobacteria bacterium]